jgi:surface polysaccharide O-acyltransferase-like enzyme
VSSPGRPGRQGGSFEMTEERSRIIWIDALRVLAVAGVVALHFSAPLVTWLPDAGSSLWWAGSIMTALVAWCVPVFIMISGAVLLDRPYHEHPSLFYQRRRRFFLQVTFWTVFYVALRFVSEPGFTAGQMLKDLLRGVPYYHLWFLYMISGLYLCTPPLCRIVRHVPRRGRIITIVAIFVFASIVTLVRDVYFPSVRQTIVTLFIPFIGYYLCGYELKKTAPDAVLKSVLGFILVVAVFWVVAVSYVSASGVERFLSRSWLFGAFSPLVIIMSVALFQLMHSAGSAATVEDGGTLGTIARLSPLVFGIYLIHPLFIRLLASAGFPGPHISPFIALPLDIVLVFFWSALSVWAVCRVRYVREIVHTSKM